MYITAILSFFISKFDIDPKTSILGVDFISLDQSTIVVGIFIIYLVLAGNYVLRLFEEQSSFSGVDTHLERLASQAQLTKAALSDTQDFIDEFNSVAFNTPVRMGNSTVTRVGSATGFVSSIESAARDYEVGFQTLKEMEDVGDRMFFESQGHNGRSQYRVMKDELDRASKSITDASQNGVKLLTSAEHAIDDLRRSLENSIKELDAKLLDPTFRRKLAKGRKARIVCFDYVVPIFAFIAVVVAFASFQSLSTGNL